MTATPRSGMQLQGINAGSGSNSRYQNKIGFATEVCEGRWSAVAVTYSVYL